MSMELGMAVISEIDMSNNFGPGPVSSQEPTAKPLLHAEFVKGFAEALQTNLWKVPSHPSACAKMEEVAFHPLVINDLQVAIEIACQEGQFRVLYPEGRAQVASRSFQMRLREDERIAVTVKSSKFAHTDDLIASQVDEDFRQRVEHWLKREQRATREEEEQERLRAAELEEKMRSSQCHRRILSKETVCLVWVTVGLAISYCVCFLNWFAFVAFAWKLLGFAGAVCLALLFFCMDRATSNTTTWQNSLLWMASAFLCFGSCYVFLRILQDEQYNSQVYEAPKYVVLVVVAFSATGPIIGIVARRMCLASGLQRRQWHQGASFEGRISQESLCITQSPEFFCVLSPTSYCPQSLVKSKHFKVQSHLLHSELFWVFVCVFSARSPERRVLLREAGALQIITTYIRTYPHQHIFTSLHPAS